MIHTNQLFTQPDVKHKDITMYACVLSTPVSVSLEVEPQLEDVVVEVTAEASLVGVLPLAVHYLEGDVFIGWARMETKHSKLRVVSTRLLQFV